MDSSHDRECVLQREIQFGEVSYEFHVCRGPDSWITLRHRLMLLDADRFVIVADQGLPAAFVAKVESEFAIVAPTLVLRVLADEHAKSLSTIDDLAERAIFGDATRRSCVVGLGGGIVGNVAGLLAGLLYRGIRLVHVPTTLLSMSDSVLSLKQAVNSRLGKNHLGVFHPPVLVWNQLEFLDTLPTEEIRSALCETIKNVLAICPERYDEVAAKLRLDGRYPPSVIGDFINLCVDAKTKVMRDDRLEKQHGLILEYGHTVGHAAELLSGGRLKHGFAIGIGTLVAARISRLLGYLSKSDEDAHRMLLARNGVPARFPDHLDPEALMQKVRFDNKRGYVRPHPGKSDFILLDALGKLHRDGTSFITQVDHEVVRAGIDAVTDRGMAPV